MRHRRGSWVFSILCLALLTAWAAWGANPCSAQEKKPYQIEIYTFKVGTLTYAMGVALAEMINKQSSWLRATAIEASSGAVTPKILAMEPAARKKIIGFMDRWEPETGYPPFKEPYLGIRGMAVIGFVTNGFVTLNPNIKTVKDFSGKKVGLGTSPSMARVDLPKAAVLRAGAKDVKFMELGFEDGVRALGDGLVDSLLSATFMSDAKNLKFAPNPALGELMATKNVSFVSFDRKAFDEAQKEIAKGTVMDYYSYEIPAGALPKQAGPWIVQGGPITWNCDREMPDDVVYEVLRIMGSNTAGFEKYHPLGKTITPENMAKLGNESVLHPGALKYYREKGIKIGSF
ncbi:MAG: hypothetical protein CVU64_07435 [Deltaproteobacteria bacterium HGW-Deltaproteobacteria-21]|nr:MAG: hypothetical protein CVU64_07435 [Deltaproteobacteria bacterium HGW-Deltaproteobacteria-21]